MGWPIEVRTQNLIKLPELCRHIAAHLQRVPRNGALREREDEVLTRQGGPCRKKRGVWKRWDLPPNTNEWARTSSTSHFCQTHTKYLAYVSLAAKRCDEAVPWAAIVKASEKSQSFLHLARLSTSRQDYFTSSTALDSHKMQHVFPWRFTRKYSSV